MDIRLLGPVRICVDGTAIDIGGPQHQLVFAILVSNGGRLTSTDWLIGQLWPDNDATPAPRKSLRARLHEIIADVRKALRPYGLLPPHQRGGYRIEVHRDLVDVLRYHELRRKARQQLSVPALAEAVDLFRHALREWGGEDTGRPAEPLTGLSAPWAQSERDWLQAAYQGDLIECLRAELVLGRQNQVIPELVNLAASGPPNEETAGLLMLAYYRAGQPAMADKTYRDTRERLSHELGADPGNTLRDLHNRILNQDPQLQLRPGRADQTTSALEVPSMQDNPIIHFTNVNGHTQISHNSGTVNIRGPQPEATLAEHIQILQAVLRTAVRDRGISAATMAAAQEYLSNALALADTEDADYGSVVTALEQVRPLLQGADWFAVPLDDAIRAAQRGAR